MNKNKLLIIISIILFLIIIGLIFYQIINKPDLKAEKPYLTNEDFGIKTIKSEIDKDNDGIDDYTDILLGARKYVKTKPLYKSEYYEDAYPPDGVGVCTDVIWQALKEAGYNIKDLIDQDIKNNIVDYKTIEYPDSNIDFRRVRNLKVYFDKYLTKLTTDITKIAEWQAGDIVVFEGHIAIISNRRNEFGRPHIIHHGYLAPSYEEDGMDRYVIVSHYRFDLNINT